MANYDQAKLDALMDIGEDGTNFDKNLSGMEGSCGEFVKRVATNIETVGLVDTGRLITSLGIEKIDASTINIMGNGYINMLDLGIKGAVHSYKAPNSPYQMTKMPPVDVFVEWIKSKNIKLRDNTKYGGSNDSIVDDEMKIKQVAYAMALKRYEDGYSPQNIFAKEIPKLIEDASDGVANRVIAELFNGIDEATNEE